MNALLLKSLKITFETTDVTLEELAIQHNLTLDELTEHSQSLNLPTTEWEKIQSQQFVPKIAPKEEEATLLPAPEEEKDTLRATMDLAYSNIVKEAADMLANSYEMEPKDLKDIAAVLKTIEDIKYPRSATQALEVDLSQGVIRMLSTIGDDI